MSGRAFTIFMVALGVVGLLVYGQLANDPSTVGLDEPAPSTELPVLQASSAQDRSTKGGDRAAPVDLRKSESASIDDYRGRWVLVNFWASWCEPCRFEAPALEEFASAQASKNFEVLGINTEDLTDDAERFLDEFSVRYSNLRDGTGDYNDEFGLVGLPESFLVAPDGTVQLIRRGPVDLDYLESQVEPFLTGDFPLGAAKAAGEAN